MSKFKWLIIPLLLIACIILAVPYLFRGGGTLSLQKTAQAWTPEVAPATGQALPRAPCTVYTPLRRAFFGDLHVHTGLSSDARSRNMLGTTEDAYRFARGEAIALGGLGGNANPPTAQLKRALDFAAVTDHAEYIGEVYTCTTPSTAAYQSTSCKQFRGELDADGEGGFSSAVDRMQSLGGLFDRKEEICGPDLKHCRDALKTAWQLNQQMTEQYYDRSADCRFTSFHGYEYSNTVSFSKVHRNIIFRNEIVPEIPISALEQPDPVGLWEDIESLCHTASGDCDAVSIPHNPNASNGRMFYPRYADESLEEQRRIAALRARMEPVVEMMQVKGESECKSGLWNVFGEDELCDFEKMFGVDDAVLQDCQDGYGSGATAGFGCQSRLDFARYALIEGMAEHERIGVNPYRFGFAGGTDSHNATPGAVTEDGYQGCCSDVDTTPEERLKDGRSFGGLPMRVRNPGGLMGIWAEENSRDALFDAMQRREVFATSGPRIQPRFFAGHQLPDTICEQNPAEHGYKTGVPMGGVLDKSPTAQSPTFVAAAQADPDGGLLQRLQIVKVWHGGEKRFHQQVYDVAGNKDNGATVNLNDCSVSGPGEAQLCATWKDPDFDPDQAAAYYLRVIENPSCRWSWRDCLSFDEASRPAACADPSLNKVIQERAWSSPVWYEP